MCGRFSLISDLSELQLRFDFENPLTDYAPRFNISPTQDVLTVRWEDGHRVGEYMRWGLIPSWAKDMSIGNQGHQRAGGDPGGKTDVPDGSPSPPLPDSRGRLL